MRSLPDAIAALALFASVVGCGAGLIEEAPPGEDGDRPATGLEARACPEDTVLTYQNFGAPMFFEYCTGCHNSDRPAGMRQGAPIEVNFDTVEDIRAHAGRIYLRAADDHDTMPPAGGPSPELRYLLGDWLACGSPE